MAAIPVFSDLTNRYIYDTVAARCDKASPITRQTLYRGAFAATGVMLLGTKAIDGVIGGITGAIAAAGHFITIFIAPKALKSGTADLINFAAPRLSAVGLGDVYIAAMKILNPQVNTSLLHRHVWSRLVYTEDAALLVFGKITCAVLGTFGAALSPLPLEQKVEGGISHWRAKTSMILNPNGLADIFTCALKVLNPNAKFHGTIFLADRYTEQLLNRITAANISAYHDKTNRQREIAKQLKQINTELWNINSKFSVSITYELDQFLLGRTENIVIFRKNVSQFSRGKTGPWVATIFTVLASADNTVLSYIKYSNAHSVVIEIF